MSDWISFLQALSRIEAQTKISKPRAALWDAIRSRQVNAGYPGRTTDEPEFGKAWTDHHLNTPLASMSDADQDAMTTVDGNSLQRWIDQLTGRMMQQRPVSQPKQPRKFADFRSMADADAPLVEIMRELLASGECTSPSAAALHVIDRAAGNGGTVSKQRRLERRYTATYGATE